MGDTFDPLTVGNYWQDSWMYNGIGNFLTVPNSVKYQFSYNGFSVDAIYGFGNHAGAMGLDSTYGVELTYVHGPASINAGFHQTSVSSLNGSSVNGAKVNFVHVSGAYQVAPAVRLLAGWLHGQDKTGTTDFNMQQAGAPTLRAGSPNRIDDTFYVGANWQATAPLLITVAGYYGRARNAERLDGTLGAGINYSATVLAEYGCRRTPRCTARWMSRAATAHSPPTIRAQPTRPRAESSRSAGPTTSARRSACARCSERRLGRPRASRAPPSSPSPRLPQR